MILSISLTIGLHRGTGEAEVEYETEEVEPDGSGTTQSALAAPSDPWPSTAFGFDTGERMTRRDPMNDHCD